MLPLSLLRTAEDKPILIELKNGETYNGFLINCDSMMNVNLREVICTSRDGDHFYRMAECYIRGNTIKYVRVPDEVLEMVKEEVIEKRAAKRVASGRGRGSFGGQQSGGAPGGAPGRGGAGMGRGGTSTGGRGGRGGQGGGRGGRGQ